MKEKFIQFLKDNGALEKFEANMKNLELRFQEDDPFNLNDLCSSVGNILDWTSFPFRWDDSPERFDYWSKLDDKWGAICESL